MKKLFFFIFILLSLHTFAVRLHGVITTKALFLKTDNLLIVMDYELFLNAFEEEYSKTERWDSEKKIIYKENGKPYRLALKNYLDSLFLINDSACINPLRPVFCEKETGITEFVASEEIKAAMFRLMKKGNVKIIEEGSAQAVTKISIRKKTYRLHFLAITGQAWIVKNKNTGKEIYSQQISTQCRAYY